jgi:hypothetical protein
MVDMGELRMLTVGGDRPISVPAGVRMAYVDSLDREHVVFVPNVLRSSLMGEWEELRLPVLFLSRQTRTLWSGAPIEWLAREEQEVRVLDAAETAANLRPLTLTASDLLEWAHISRDAEIKPLLVEAALDVLAWLGRPPMSPQQHAQWTRQVRDAETAPTP